MGCVQQAVLEFDEEVQAPWRPLLVPATGAARVAAAPAARPEPARPRPSRGGDCRPPEVPDRHAQGVPSASGRRLRGRGRRNGPGIPAASSTVGHRRGATRPTTIRFTRRAHRLAVALALGAGVLAGSWLGQLLPDGGGEGLRLAGVGSVVVEQGDTVWSIATSVAGEEDVRTMVDRIQELNGLEGADLVPGQVLLLP